MEGEILIKTWHMLKIFTDNRGKKIKAYVASQTLREEEKYPYDYVTTIDGVFYWNDDLQKPFRLNDFYNVLDIDWYIKKSIRIRGVDMNRSCEYCKWRYEQESLIGTIQMCNMDEKETKLDSYCENFRQKKK